MSDKIDVLSIDDDKFIQKVICKILADNDMSARTANDGASGVIEALNKTPDIILLDIEMPGLNGYEVCEQLRSNAETSKVPIIFLSSNSSLRQRMQGYEVGADDYMIKPFETENLLARIRVLLKFRDERAALQAQFEMAQKTALLAMTGTSELGHAINFLEKSLSYQSITDTANGLLEVTQLLSLECCLLISAHDEQHWHSSQGTISPLEKDLIEMSDPDARFADFGTRTIINYPYIQLLVKNMPLDDMERYGRIKDLLPVMLSGANTKVNVLMIQGALTEQSGESIQSFHHIRGNLYHLASTILDNRSKSADLMQALVHDLNSDLLRMGLEEDQEDYLINRIDTAIAEAMTQMDAGAEIRSAFTFILNNLKTMMDQQQALLDNFNASQATTSQADPNDLGDIELF